MLDTEIPMFRDRIRYDLHFEGPSRAGSASKSQKMWSFVFGVRGAEKSCTLSEKQVAEVLAAVDAAVLTSLAKLGAKEKGHVR